ncbi:hypothetical protein TPHA_0F01120 [Tetrapisispora phaffii CBS 4417]|uniref:Mitochondrial inner membrane protein COX18 n=1 Tax=Tetrapisispora phaffii (strain ATCC 24235 / CBS 4417 / NBRC 1672 / NRRL Y-8282 / UCD 70-5) TaxID=1071381 RepID=G8BV15_TETPH|nr:hypothetical protein TPHA_0F01120 [Tetrapisispora phaffii CBS 4417]CCE63597.1 hypothetical protein TPHA_0F01120 [Tetrapisispora phaffii CBS 4417]
MFTSVYKAGFFPLVSATRTCCIKTTSRSRSFSTITAVAEAFVSLHEVTNIPWVILIPLSSVTLRTLFTLPLSILQRQRLVKQNNLRNVVLSIKPVVALRLAQTQKLTPEQIKMLSLKESRNRQKKLFKKYNIDLWKNMILPLVQIPLWVTISLGIRRLVTDPDSNTMHVLKETNTDNILYANNILESTLDLSLPFEPLPMLLPVILGTLSIMNVEYNGIMFARRRDKALVGGKLSNAMNSVLNVSRMSSVFMMGISTQTSMILSIYWITSQLFSYIQNKLLDCLWPLHNKNDLM